MAAVLPALCNPKVTQKKYWQKIRSAKITKLPNRTNLPKKENH